VLGSAVKRKSGDFRYDSFMSSSRRPDPAFSCLLRYNNSGSEEKKMRIRIGGAFGIPVYLHWTFFLLPLWVMWTYQDNSPFSLAVTLTGVLLVFACIVLHEFGHALTARYFGIDTQDVTLYPIGGVARLTRMTDKPLEEILIAVAGPAVNVVIAILLSCVLLPVAAYDINLVEHTFAGSLAKFVLIMNVVLVLFNMLPLFPMDGGRVFRALLSFGLGHYRATQIAVGVGLGLTILIGFTGLLFNFISPMFLVVALFVFLAGQAELQAARYREYHRAQPDDEPLTVLPVRPEWNRYPGQPAPQSPPLIFQPKISVYTWDNLTGTWRPEPGTRP